MSSWSSAGSSAEESDNEQSDLEEGIVLPSITISVDQLCRKLRKMNRKFTYEFINECDDEDDCGIEHHELAEALSPVKH